MVSIIIRDNDAGQRLDRFLKKYLRAAPLSLVYRLIRKDVKVNGARRSAEHVLAEGDEVTLYIDDARLDELTRRTGSGDSVGARSRPKIQFGVCYDDDNVLAVSKPYGLLTHGDEREKKNTLVNQVTGYLLDRGEYDPAAERMFTPSPVNRLDRNTSGIVIFGKNAKAVRDFSRMMASVDSVQKYYMALALGEIPDELTLDGGIAKDADRNMVSVSDSGRPSMTVVSPVESFRLPGQAYTLCEVRLVTGRPHQIRAHLAAAGHPVVGDPKYGDRRANRRFADSCGLESQFLHAHRLVVAKGLGSLEYLSGASMDSPLPRRLTTVMDFLRSRAGSAD